MYVHVGEPLINEKALRNSVNSLPKGARQKAGNSEQRREERREE